MAVVLMARTGTLPCPPCCIRAPDNRSGLMNLCGHGHFDMQAYMDFAAGKLEDYEYPAEAIKAAMENLPQVKMPA